MSAPERAVAGSFVRIPDEFLASIATDSDRIPQYYYHGSRALREVFWQRLRFIHRMARRDARLGGRCLDFGGGGGVFVPTLCATFASVVSIDLETSEASQLVAHYGLENVSLVRGDIHEAELEDAPFDAIVAADVLEHFRELDPPVTALRRWLAPGGLLFTSLPTENWVYRVLRRVYGVEKPPDHYHTAYEVEAHLQRSGFRRRRRWRVPLQLPLIPLYLVSEWELRR